MPCWELFDAQPVEYRRAVLGSVPRIAVEAGAKFGWERYVGDSANVIGLDGFGASGPAEAVYEHFGITPRAVADLALRACGKN
jgi:transketolase